MKVDTYDVSSYYRKAFALCLLMLMVWLCPQSVVADSSQTKTEKYSIEIGNTTFAQAVKQIEAKTVYTFSYEKTQVNEGDSVSVSVKNGTINDIVRQLIRGLNLSYEIKAHHVILKAKVASTQSVGSAQSKPRKVTGVVKDAAGEPLIGATVNVKGTKNYTITDIDGNYTIDVPASGKRSYVAVSYVGYVPQEREVGQASKLDFLLKENTEMLDDVVVIGYGQIKKESVTSAISTVSSDALSVSTASNTSGALAGKVAGINSRMSDGRPGAFTTLNIRNMGTPLYVVDGVQMDENQFNNIDFNDIESISVLKDASASIYGVRAANGVVVVTTKTGKRNMKSQLNVNGYYGIQSLFRFPKPADAATYVKAQIQSSTLLGAQSKYSLDDLAKWQEGTEKGYQGFNWYDYIFTNAPQYYGNINAQGGSDRVNYYLSLGHLRQESIINNYGHFARTNVQLNVDADITDKLKMKASVNGRAEETVRPGVPMDDDYWTALYAVMNNLPTNRPFANDNPDYPAQTGTAGYTNFANLNYERSGKYQDKWKVIQGNLSLEYEPVKNLKLKALGSYYFSHRDYNNQEKGYKLYSYSESTDTYMTVVDASGNFKERIIASCETLNGQLSADYKVTFDKAHNLSLFAGMEAYQTKSPSLYISGNPSAAALKLFYFDDVKSISDVGENKQARLGYMGRINYDYKGKYLLEASARYDGSWMFAPENRWGFFPSVSAGWRISQENFWTGNNLDKVVSDLKIRASYGLLGDDNVSGYSAYDYLDGYNYNTGGAVLDGSYITGSTIRELASKNLSWIKANMFDVGFDISFFNNRLSGSADYFDRTRTGLPASRYDKILPSEVGFSLPYENLNADKQRGMDASIIWRDVVGDFTYSISGNFTLSRTYNWYQYNPTFGNSRNYYVYNSTRRYSGQSWALVCTGQFQSWEQIATWPVDIDGKGNSTLRPGDLIYKDINGDGIITDDDQKPVGILGYDNQKTPIISYNFSINLGWKGINVAADFTGAGKSTYWFNYETRNPFHGSANNPQYMLGDQWMLSDVTDINSELIPGTFPSVIEGNSAHSNYTSSTFWMRNVRYLKLRNLEISYTFPQKWMTKSGISKLRIYTMMQNLFSIDNVHDREVDPEIYSASGLNYPTNRIINFGFNLYF